MSAVIERRDDQPSEAMSLIQVIERAALNPAIDVEKMERLFALHERILARNAEVAFDEALSLVQQEMPQVERDAKNDQTSSWYARLETLNAAVIPVYTKHGFSLSFGEEDCPKEGHQRVVCFCSRAGHTRKYHSDVPIDLAGLRGNQNKTHTHAFGSTQSYGRRYLTLMIFNVVMAGEDKDGNAEPGEPGEEPVDMAAVQKFVSRFTDAFDADIQENERAAKIYAIHQELQGKQEEYIAVGKLLGTTRKNAIRKYVDQHKEIVRGMKQRMRER